MTVPSTTSKRAQRARRAQTGGASRPAARTLLHVGEWQVELHGDSREDVFRRIAALIAFTSGRGVGPFGRWQRVVLAARDDVALLVDWANELIGRSEVTGLAFSDLRNLEIECPASDSDSAWHLTADIRGRPVAEWRSSLKTATYHDAVLAHERGRWRGRLLFDI